MSIVKIFKKKKSIFIQLNWIERLFSWGNAHLFLKSSSYATKIYSGPSGHELDLVRDSVRDPICLGTESIFPAELNKYN